jgi:hypothetical protein
LNIQSFFDRQPVKEEEIETTIKHQNSLYDGYEIERDLFDTGAQWSF